jgi:hypothetical protein
MPAANGFPAVADGRSKCFGLDRFSMCSDSAKKTGIAVHLARAGLQFLATKLFRGVHMICNYELAWSIGGVGCER